MPQEKKKILIIDDDGTLVHLLLLRLQHLGFLVDVALDGETGLKEALFFQPNIILLDIGMPKMGGWEICERLRSDPKTKNMPIIIITGLQPDDVKKRAQLLGIGHILCKPFQDEKLLGLLKSEMV